MNQDLLDMLKRNRTVNGIYKQPLPLFSDGFKDKARSHIGPARIEFYMQHRARFTEQGGLLAGDRFNNDEAILLRMLSGLLKYSEVQGQSIAEVEKMEQHFLDVWGTLAVKDCCEADHWYMFGKDYGTDEPEPAMVSSGAEATP